MNDVIEYYGTGRRKTSTARVFLRPGAGKLEINGREIGKYFSREVLVMLVKQPLALTETAEKFDITATVEGSDDYDVGIEVDRRMLHVEQDELRTGNLGDLWHSR